MAQATQDLDLAARCTSLAQTVQAQKRNFDVGSSQYNKYDQAQEDLLDAATDLDNNAVSTALAGSLDAENKIAALAQSMDQKATAIASQESNLASLMVVAHNFAQLGSLFTGGAVQIGQVLTLVGQLQTSLNAI